MTCTKIIFFSRCYYLGWLDSLRTVNYQQHFNTKDNESFITDKSFYSALCSPSLPFHPDSFPLVSYQETIPMGGLTLFKDQTEDEREEWGWGEGKGGEIMVDM